jgi:hypothetical protein
MKKQTKNTRLKQVALNNLKRFEGLKRAGAVKRKKQKNKPRSFKIQTFRIVAPEEFSLNSESDRHNLISFVENIDLALRKSTSNVYIVFSKTKKLHPSGTLYFRAHISRFIELHPNRISCSYPVDDIVGQLFQHIGLLTKMGLSDRYSIQADNVKYWHSVEGNKADTRVFQELLDSYANELAKPMKTGLYDSMSEAITNCVQHAYETIPQERMEHKWWMFAKKTDNNLTVAIYDLGIGVAESLRIKPELMDYLKGLIWRSKKSDIRLLKLAVGSYKTRTQLTYRGKGLPEMLDFIKQTTVGGLMIHSNHGAYFYSADSGREIVKSYSEPLIGTLVQWTLPLIDGVSDGE